MFQAHGTYSHTYSLIEFSPIKAAGFTFAEQKGTLKSCSQYMIFVLTAPRWKGSKATILCFSLFVSPEASFIKNAHYGLHVRL